MELLTTSFQTFERKIRDQLARVLKGGGFDPARDIDAMTVNRWPHGYAYEYNPLWDPDWMEGQSPCEIGRKPVGLLVRHGTHAMVMTGFSASGNPAHGNGYTLYSIWVSDDADRVPLLLVAKTDYGDVRMEIIDYAAGQGKRLGTTWGGGGKRPAERPTASPAQP